MHSMYVLGVPQRRRASVAVHSAPEYTAPRTLWFASKSESVIRGAHIAQGTT